MKKIIVLLLALILILSLCACKVNGGSDPGHANNPETSEPGDDASDDPSNAPEDAESDNNSTFNIKYDLGMTSSEDEDGMVCISSGDNKLYIEDVTDKFNPDNDEPSDFLYNYAYDNCVKLINKLYGEVESFGGEVALTAEGNELCGFAANMTCEGDTYVYAFVKLIVLEDGTRFAVETGICNMNYENVFDDVEIG